MCKEELVTELERDCVGERIYMCVCVEKHLGYL